ncbi:hypothetical protein [Acidipropionibacterium timonense]|uniref:hypothetical protein n=1 Tax=Acidipropionibacterium timonense TaxID=2161818 RepID=UPI001031B989|nr:hypothetical protein [Acidipropionibacterium timonense]
MGRRVLTVTEMTFHQARVHNGETRAPSDLDGADLLEVFHDWVTAIPEEDQSFAKQQTYVRVESVIRVGARVEFLDLRVGSYGEPGEVRDIKTGTVVHTITDDEAPVGSNRALLFVPLVGERAYFLAEESSRGSAGGRIMAMFKHHFSTTMDTVTLVTSKAVEAESWLELANLTEVEVRTTGKSVDVADGPDVKVGRVSYLARPERGLKFFPRRLLGRLTDQDVLKQIVSVQDLDPSHEVYVTMQQGGRSRKFLLGDESGPAIRELLSAAGDPPLPDNELISRCTDRVSRLLERQGGQWNPIWSNRPRE